MNAAGATSAPGVAARAVGRVSRALTSASSTSGGQVTPRVWVYHPPTANPAATSNQPRVETNTQIKDSAASIHSAWCGRRFAPVVAGCWSDGPAVAPSEGGFHGFVDPLLGCAGRNEGVTVSAGAGPASTGRTSGSIAVLGGRARPGTTGGGEAGGRPGCLAVWPRLYRGPSVCSDGVALCGVVFAARAGAAIESMGSIPTARWIRGGAGAFGTVIGSSKRSAACRR